MRLFSIFICFLLLTSAFSQHDPRFLYYTGTLGVPYAGVYGANVIPTTYGVSPFTYGYPYGSVPYTGVYGARPLAMQSNTGVRTVIVHENGTTTTVTCDSSCASCLGPKSDQCLSCAVGRYPQRLEGKNTLVCLLHPEEK